MAVEWRPWLERLRAALIDQPRRRKRAIVIAVDFVLLLFAVWLAFSLRAGRPYVPEGINFLLTLLSAPLVSIAVLHTFGLYKVVTRFFNPQTGLRIIWTIGLSVLIWSLGILMVGGMGNPKFVVPRGVIAFYFIFAASLIWSSRLTGARVFGVAPSRTLSRAVPRRVAIYGAGPPGLQLLNALLQVPGYDVVGFIDDQESLVGRRLGGLKVYRFDKLTWMVANNHVKEVFLALPAERRRERRQIIQQLAALPIRVKTIPAIEDIASGRVAVTDLRSVEIDDLLGREPVPPVADLLGRSIHGKAVMVTGAGGSIGSELARQILQQNPRCLVLYELSEASLYNIHTEIADMVAQRGAAYDASEAVQIVGVLGTVLDAQLLQTTIEQYRIETIYHAAAYKHVPIVEANPIVGLRNNTFGALTIAEVARRCNVARVVLVSTDKAVRPTSVMGASKRLSELIFQCHAAEIENDPKTDGDTVFAIVRFGNVLGSSGSVVERFRCQIEAGGPVTVTHPEIIRYFMSIPEAAALVIQAGTMARGGEVFVLDMGEPIKITELAQTMIRLMGLEVRDEATPEGDIAINFIGLRPGEKLYEELLIDEHAARTEHPRIRRNSEPFLSRKRLQEELDTLEKAMQTGQIEQIHAALARSVEGYKPDLQQAEVTISARWMAASRTLH